MRKEKLQHLFDIVWPYLVILILSICGTYLVFYLGVIKGHDYKFHVANVIEQFETIKANGTLSPISGFVAMGLGNGTRLFYAPLPHLTVSLLAFVFNDILVSFKVVLVLSVIISGIFMYRFAMHFTRGNKTASLIAAAIFVIWPYRIMDAFVRFAFAETLAIAILPLFFMGLYDICHLEKNKSYFVPFIEVILGASLLFLCHNLTAFYAYALGLIFLLFNIKYLVKEFKDGQFWIFSISSAILIVCITAVSLFSQLELLHSALYAVSDGEKMLTDLDHVLQRVKQWGVFSGFLNIDNLAYWFNSQFTTDSLLGGILLFVGGCIISIVVNIILNHFPKTKKFASIVAISLVFAVISIYGRRIEIYLAATIYSVILIFINHYSSKDETTVDCFKSNKFWFDPMVYYCISMIVVLFILLTCEWPWKILPEMFLKLQFPWRLWGLIQLYVAILGGLIIQHFNFKQCGSYALCGLTALLLVVNNPLVDKRACRLDKLDEVWVSETDYGLLDAGAAIGFSKEYVPLTLLDKNYRSQYANSLWYNISTKIKYNFDNYEDYMFDPVILVGTGEGHIEVINAFAPNYNMNIAITSEKALVQMPLLYYPGYEITMTSNDNKVSKVYGINIDGLVAFEINQGDYKVTTNFVGSPIRRAGEALTYTGITLTGLGIIYGLFFDKRVKKYLKDRKANSLKATN